VPRPVTRSRCEAQIGRLEWVQGQPNSEFRQGHAVSTEKTIETLRIRIAFTAMNCHPVGLGWDASNGLAGGSSARPESAPSSSNSPRATPSKKQRGAPIRKTTGSSPAIPDLPSQARCTETGECREHSSDQPVHRAGAAAHRSQCPSLAASRSAPPVGGQAPVVTPDRFVSLHRS